MGEAPLDFFDRHDVAIADHQIDIIQPDALGVEAIVDGLLVKAGGVFVAGYSLLGDRIRDLAVAQEARADIVVICTYSENIGVFCLHRSGWMLSETQDANQSGVPALYCVISAN